MSKGHHKIHPCPVCTAKMIMEACGAIASICGGSTSQTASSMSWA